MYSSHDNVDNVPPGSLKQPSRRRPVSVDCDGKTGPKIGSPGILQKVGGAQVDSNRMSYYSNRSSQPMTEREVEQGFQYFEQKDKGMGCVGVSEV